MGEPQDPHGGQPYGQPPQYGQYGQPQYGQPQYGQGPQYGQPPQYGQYGQPQYGQPPQYGQYPPAYGQPYGQQPYGYGPYPPPNPYGTQPGRPGMATAAAILAFVASGLLIIAAIILFVGADVLDSTDSSLFNDGSVSTEIVIDGIVNLIAAGLLLAGGVQLTARKKAGWIMVLSGCGIVVICALYWLIRPADVTATIFWALLFAAIVVVAASMVLTPTVRNWLMPRTHAGA